MRLRIKWPVLCADAKTIALGLSAGARLTFVLLWFFFWYSWRGEYRCDDRNS